MMRLFILLILVVSISCNSGPDKPFEGNSDSALFAGKPVFNLLPAAEIPPGITVKGNVEEAWKWTDVEGDHILVLSRVAPHNVPPPAGEEEGGQTAEIYAASYLLTAGNPALTWKLEDREQNCPLDIACAFITGSTTITDLDSNGVAEIKIQYEKTCRGDVSPSNMKLVMFEGSKKYILEGARWLRSEPEDVFDVTIDNVNLEKLPKKGDEIDRLIQGMGRYENESSFAGAAPAFLVFARAEWLKFVKENIGGQ